ncbi:MAG: PqqD family protein [Acidobacteriota bacterium]
MSTLTSRYGKKGDLVTRTIADETIIVPISRHVANLNAVFTLNEVATSVWQLIDGQMTVAEIIDKITQEYEIDEKTVVDDIFQFLDQLEAIGLILPIKGKEV